MLVLLVAVVPPPDLNGENRDLWAGELATLPLGDEQIPLLAGVRGECAGGWGVLAPPPTI